MWYIFTYSVLDIIMTRIWKDIIWHLYYGLTFTHSYEVLMDQHGERVNGWVNIWQLMMMMMMMMMIMMMTIIIMMFNGHFCAHSKLNEPSDLLRKWGQNKDETPFGHTHVEIWTQMVEICGQPHDRLDHESAINIWQVNSLACPMHTHRAAKLPGQGLLIFVEKTYNSFPFRHLIALHTSHHQK